MMSKKVLSEKLFKFVPKEKKKEKTGKSPHKLPAVMASNSNSIVNPTDWEDEDI